MSISIEAPVVINCAEVKNSVKSFELSTKYMIRLTKIAMFNIIIRRIQVPDDQVIERSAFGKVPYFTFRKKSPNKVIEKFHEFALGVIEALEKGFLKEANLFILRSSTNELLESYVLKYKYNKDAEGKPGTKDPKTVEAGFLSVLTRIKDLPGDKWPEDDVELMCQISYHENAPATYEPVNFYPSNANISFDRFKQVYLGDVHTGFHKFIGYGRGVNIDALRAEQEEEERRQSMEDGQRQKALEEEQQALEEEQQALEEEQQAVKIESQEYIQPDSPEILKKSKNKRIIVDDDDEVIQGSPKKAKSLHIIESDIENSDKASSVSSHELEACVCEWRNLGSKFVLIKCTECYESVHLVCNGYLNIQALDRKNFVCLSCRFTDKRYNMSRAHLRLILYGIYMEKGIPGIMHNANKVQRNQIMNKLQKYGVVPPESIEINNEALEEAIKKRFQDGNQMSEYLCS